MRDISLFSEELNLIDDEKLKKFAVECLKETLQYFWFIPASSSGQYHPAFAQGEGGLVRHTKATITVATDILKAYPHLMPVKDQIIIALLLHDTIKLGIPPKETTDPNHPMCPREYYKRLGWIIPLEQYDFIMDVIETHMGIWGPKLNNQSSSRLSANEFVHICDYIASRKWAEKLFCKKPDEELLTIQSKLAEENRELRRQVDELGDYISQGCCSQTEAIQRISEEQQRWENLLYILKDIYDMMQKSQGITGWHLNNAIAFWDEFEFTAQIKQAIESPWEVGRKNE